MKRNVQKYRKNRLIMSLLLLFWGHVFAAPTLNGEQTRELITYMKVILQQQQVQSQRLQIACEQRGIIDYQLGAAAVALGEQAPRLQTNAACGQLQMLQTKMGKEALLLSQLQTQLIKRQALEKQTTIKWGHP